MIDPSNVNELKRDAGRLAARMGWTVGQKELARPGRPIERFKTWLALWFKLSRIVEDIDRVRRARTQR